jgi:uncharacterized phage protein (TIGR02216 family)
MAGLDWTGLMALGLGRLGLSARDFWALSPRELAAMLKGRGLTGSAPPTRQSLEALMRAFPDGDPHA